MHCLDSAQQDAMMNIIIFNNLYLFSMYVLQECTNV